MKEISPSFEFQVEYRQDNKTAHTTGIDISANFGVGFLLDIILIETMAMFIDPRSASLSSPNGAWCIRSTLSNPSITFAKQVSTRCVLVLFCMLMKKSGPPGSPAKPRVYFTCEKLELYSGNNTCGNLDSRNRPLGWKSGSDKKLVAAPPITTCE